MLYNDDALSLNQNAITNDRLLGIYLVLQLWSTGKIAIWICIVFLLLPIQAICSAMQCS